MKILVVHCAYRYRGGEDKVVQEESRLLEQSGHRVRLLSFTNEGNGLVKILQLPFNLASYRKTRKAIRDFSPDVVHVHNLHFAASPSVLYAARRCKVPVVCTLHNYRLVCPSGILFHNEKAFLHSLNGKFPWTAVRNGVYKNSRLLTFWVAISMQLHHWLGTWHLPGRYIVLSRHAKNIFVGSKLGFSEDQFVVKPNFCSATDKQDAGRNDAFLFVGRLSVEKGVRFLLKLFAHSPYRIAIAGDGPLKDEVMAYAKAHENIVYAGSLQTAELTRLMKQSSALVFPSIWYEGMPLTIIEAFANGLPVIATKLGAMEHMVTPNHDGLLFEAGNENGLRETLGAWSMLSHEEREAFGKRARETYEKNYTPEMNARLLLAVYDGVQPAKPQPVPAFH